MKKALKWFIIGWIARRVMQQYLLAWDKINREETTRPNVGFVKGAHVRLNDGEYVIQDVLPNGAMRLHRVDA